MPTPAVQTEHHPRAAALRAVRNILSSYGVMAASIASSILITPLLLHALGAVDFSLLRLTQSLFGYLGLLDLGLTSSIVYFVARYRSSQARGDLDSFASTLLVAISSIAALAVAGTVLAAPLLTAVFAIPPERVAVAETVFRISAIHFGANLIGSLFGGILAGSARYDIDNAITVAYLCAIGIGTFVAVQLGHGLLSIAGLTAVVAVLATLARIGAVSWLRLCTIRLDLARRAVVRQAWGYGIWSFLNGLAGQLGFATTDMLIISRVLGVSSVAIYSVVIAPVTLATDLVYRAVDVFQPTITAIAYRQGGKADDVGRALLTLMKAVITIGWCLTLMLCLAGKEFLDLWVGSVDDVAGPLMVVFALGFGSLHVGHVCGLVLLGVARHRILGAMAIADGLANVGLSALLATQYGLLGIAWGTLISQSISNLLVIPLYACRVTKLPIREYAFLLVRAVPLFAASMAIGRLVDTLDLGYFQTVVLRCLIAGVIFLAGCWLLVFSAADREAVVSEAGRFLRRGRAGPAEGRLGAMAAE